MAPYGNVRTMIGTRLNKSKVRNQVWFRIVSQEETSFTRKHSAVVIYIDSRVFAKGDYHVRISNAAAGLEFYGWRREKEEQKKL